MTKSSRYPRLASTRQGTTLVQTVIMMAIGSSALMLAILMIHLVLRMNSQVEAAEQQQHVIVQLATMFRDDVHAAKEMSVARQDGKTERLTLSSGAQAGKTVSYEVDGNRLHRIVQQGDQREAVETYSCPVGTGWSFERFSIPADAQQSFCRMNIRLPSAGKRSAVEKKSPHGESRKLIVLEARLGGTDR